MSCERCSVSTVRTLYPLRLIWRQISSRHSSRSSAQMMRILPTIAPSPLSDFSTPWRLCWVSNIKSIHVTWKFFWKNKLKSLLLEAKFLHRCCRGGKADYDPVGGNCLPSDCSRSSEPNYGLLRGSSFTSLFGYMYPDIRARLECPPAHFRGWAKDFYIFFRVFCRFLKTMVLTFSPKCYHVSTISWSMTLRHSCQTQNTSKLCMLCAQKSSSQMQEKILSSMLWNFLSALFYSVAVKLIKSCPNCLNWRLKGLWRKSKLQSYDKCAYRYSFGFCHCVIDCNQVVIAAIVTNADYVLQLLNEIRFPNTNEPIGADHFVRKWLNHIEDFSGIDWKFIRWLVSELFLNLLSRHPWPTCLYYGTLRPFAVSKQACLLRRS